MLFIRLLEFALLLSEKRVEVITSLLSAIEQGNVQDVFSRTSYVEPPFAPAHVMDLAKSDHQYPLRLVDSLKRIRGDPPMRARYNGM
jgi:hypothetical protein